MPGPPTRHRLAILAALLAVAAFAGRACASGRVDVVVDGLDADMKRNVLSSLEIATLPRDASVSEPEMLRLMDRAPEQIATALEPFGFYRPVIRDAVKPNGGGWTVHYTIDPGPPTTLTDVDVRIDGPGAGSPGFRRALDAFTLRRGSRLEHAPYEQLKQSIDAAAASGGYLDGRYVDRRIEVDRERSAARIVLRYDTGPRFRFGPVRFSQDVLDSAFMHSFVPFHEGQPYDADSLVAMQNALGRSPYFARVEIEPRRDEADSVSRRVPIDVNLSPGKRLRYTFGAGYGTDTGPQATASLEFKRLDRHGHRGDLSGLLSPILQQSGVQLQVPRAFGRPQMLTYSAAFARERTETQHSLGGQVGVALSRVRAGWQETFGLYFQRQSFTVGEDTGVPNLLVPDLHWTAAVADDRIVPRVARKLEFRVRGASERALSDVGFAQLNASAKWIQGFASANRALLRLSAGRTFTKRFHALPPAERYFGGGAQDVRAFRYQQLGPRDAADEPTGGSTAFVVQLELEQRVLASWAVAGFYDVGGVFEGRTRALGGGPGVGLRWISPVGMVRLDFAFPVQKADLDPRPVALQFSIGPDL